MYPCSVPFVSFFSLPKCVDEVKTFKLQARHTLSLITASFQTLAIRLAASIAICIPFSGAQARSYIPSECGTYVQCQPALHSDAPLNGQQQCVNYDKPHIKVMIATWKNDLLDGYFWCGNDEGVKRIETNFRRGAIHGLFKANYGTSAGWTYQQMHKDGKPEGLGRRQMNNDFSAVVFYRDGQRHGYELHLDPQNRIHKLGDCHVDEGQSAGSVCRDSVSRIRGGVAGLQDRRSESQGTGAEQVG
ncbi:hypothetical protein [Noviherbaspirillum album]|uniref:hypothetical protein n=1 Tax=Noviherbaspirillum album TaxID=3080276 RepID=UPI002DD62C03|nr:hypothetical protein [Noviherbaspirillum sp. CPCC 100848]